MTTKKRLPELKPLILPSSLFKINSLIAVGSTVLSLVTETQVIVGTEKVGWERTEKALITLISLG